MLGRRSNQKTFFDEVVSKRISKNHFLGINDMIDWTPIEKRLEILYDPSNGRPSYPPLVMFKALLLQQWFNLSDRDLSEAIADRLSFQSFLGLSLTDPVPDDTTFCRFRQKLLELGLLEELFSLLDAQFEDLGILVKKGSFIDATIVQAQRRPPSKETKEEDGSVDSAGDGENRKGSGSKASLTKDGKIYFKSDPDARWTVKRGKPAYGYKVHVNTDESGIVRCVEVTPANVHDSRKLKSLISKKETEAIFADKAYDSQGIRSWCEQRGIKCFILHKGKRNKPLTEEEIQENKMLSKKRFRVEQVFGIAKSHYGMNRLPYVGLMRNKVKTFMVVMAMNLKRAWNIMKVKNGNLPSSKLTLSTGD